MSHLVQIWLILGHNLTSLVKLTHRAKMYWIWSEQFPDLSHLGANLTHFGSKSGHHGWDSGVQVATFHHLYILAIVCSTFKKSQIWLVLLHLTTFHDVTQLSSKFNLFVYKTPRFSVFSTKRLLHTLRPVTSRVSTSQRLGQVSIISVVLLFDFYNSDDKLILHRVDAAGRTERLKLNAKKT